MGRIASCSYMDGDEAISMELNKADCLAKGYDWDLPPDNYNNIFASMLTFFEISTLEMWPDIMFNAFDSSEKVDGIMKKDRS